MVRPGGRGFQAKRRTARAKAGRAHLSVLKFVFTGVKYNRKCTMLAVFLSV